jgi:hypothetical protein
MKNLSVQKTAIGGTWPSCPFPTQSHCSRSMGNPYTGHSGKTLRIGFSLVNSHVCRTG